MPILILLGAAVLAALVWTGRRPVRIAGAARLWAALFAALAAVASVVTALRGAWIASLVLVGLAAWISGRARLGQTQTKAGRPYGTMDVREARSILGVSDRAGKVEVLEAYKRLMRVAHPDLGGSTGLAAKLNAARDVLLGRADS